MHLTLDITAAFFWVFFGTMFAWGFLAIRADTKSHREAKEVDRDWKAALEWANEVLLAPEPKDPKSTNHARWVQATQTALRVRLGKTKETSWGPEWFRQP